MNWKSTSKIMVLVMGSCVLGFSAVISLAYFMNAPLMGIITEKHRVGTLLLLMALWAYIMWMYLSERRPKKYEELTHKDKYIRVYELALPGIGIFFASIFLLCLSYIEVSVAILCAVFGGVLIGAGMSKVNQFKTLAAVREWLDVEEPKCP